MKKLSVKYKTFGMHNLKKLHLFKMIKKMKKMIKFYKKFCKKKVDDVRKKEREPRSQLEIAQGEL